MIDNSIKAIWEFAIVLIFSIEKATWYLEDQLLFIAMIHKKLFRWKICWNDKTVCKGKVEKETELKNWQSVQLYNVLQQRNNLTLPL